MNKIIKQLISFSFALCCFSGLVFAEPGAQLKVKQAISNVKPAIEKKEVDKASKTITLKLANIVVKKPSEKGGDELYFTIAEYRTGKKSSYLRIPNAPAHWLSSYINKIKDLTIWEGKLEEGHSVNLIVSLLEQDVPPLDPDDLIGDFKIKVTNKGGHIISNWTIPNTGRTPLDSPDKNNKFKKVVLNNEGAIYLLTLKLFDK